MPNDLNNRMFVAGASSVIGRRLCPLLVDAAWDVVIVISSEEGIGEYEKGDTVFVDYLRVW